jgi:hypothetical protein
VDPAVTLSLTLPSSVVALAASDPTARFVVTNTEGGKTTPCSGETNFDASSSVLTVEGCGYGTYAVQVVQAKASAGGGGSGGGGGGSRVSPSSTPDPDKAGGQENQVRDTVCVWCGRLFVCWGGVGGGVWSVPCLR